ncbi:MAG: fumarylacetoacetate hydrolase family protein [Flavobacteriales bacterium]|nr:fumarylacetoacetate hydrolase family protein [Flavobacteriales bacterium]
MDLIRLALKLDSAAVNAIAVKQLSTDYTYDLQDAYEIQRLAIEPRKERGFALIGLKMGFTSVAKMEQMGVHDMIWGRLTADMDIPNQGSTSMAKYIHPRAEPEICFRIAKDIKGEIALEDLDEYVDAIAPAIEIIDSRFENFKFTLEDVVADNCSSTGLIIGDWQEPSRDISNLRMQLFFDNEEVAVGSSHDILGDPWKSLQAATRLAAAYNEPIKAGHVIMAGAATAAVFLKPGIEVVAKVEGMQDVIFSVSD